MALPANAASMRASESGSVPRAIRKLKLWPEHLFPGVSGQFEKGVIGKNYRVAGLFCVRKHHCHACRFSGNDERAKILAESCRHLLRRLFGLRT